MSKKLMLQICIILKDKLSPIDPLYPNIEREFNAAYKKLKSQNTEGHKITGYEYEEFMAWALNANKFTALLHDPGETFWTEKSETKDELDYLLNRLFELVFKNFKGTAKECLDRLVETDDELTLLSNLNDRYSYKIYVPTFSIAVKFWKSLSQFFYQEKLSEYSLSPEEKVNCMIKFFTMFNSLPNEKDKIIGVYKTDPYLTSVPLIFCQSHKPLPSGDQYTNEQLFVMDLPEGIIKGVISMSPASLNNWKDNIYYHLNTKSGKDRFGIEEINFADYLEDIISMSSFVDLN